MSGGRPGAPAADSCSSSYRVAAAGGASLPFSAWPPSSAGRDPTSYGFTSM